MLPKDFKNKSTMKLVTSLVFLSFASHPAVGSLIRRRKIKGSDPEHREIQEVPDRKPMPPVPKTELRLPGTSTYIITPIPTARPPSPPSIGPSATPSESTAPSIAPTYEPSSMPSHVPSESPSAAPTQLPSEQVSDIPSDIPSDVPSDVPSMSPTKQPTKAPTKFPTFSPTKAPTAKPFYSLAEVGNDGNPGDVFPLGRCEGDCDSNGDCEGDLICIQRDDNEEVPGCGGSAIAGVDYCTDSSYRPDSIGNGDYNFQLRLYWKSGYYWQETNRETWWCMECARCDAYTLEDGPEVNCAVPGNSGSSCREGHHLWIRECKDDRRDVKFNIITNSGSGDQVRVAGTNLCLSTVNNKYLELKPCNKNSSRQLFATITNLSKFVLRPYSQRTWTENIAKCISQLHHPKNKEVVGLHQCEEARNHQTIYWEEYH
jgi:hypothetical protein